MAKSSVLECTFKTVWDEAEQAGQLAARATKPTPMVVQQHANPLDDKSPVVKEWAVPARWPADWSRQPSKSYLTRSDRAMEAKKQNFYQQGYIDAMFERGLHLPADRADRLDYLDGYTSSCLESPEIVNEIMQLMIADAAKGTGHRRSAV